MVGREVALGYKHSWQLANFILAVAPAPSTVHRAARGDAERTIVPIVSDHDVLKTTGPRLLTRVVYALPAGTRGPIRILQQINWNPPGAYPRIGPLAQRIHARRACSGNWRSKLP
jgi:hypothetical protein